MKCKIVEELWRRVGRVVKSVEGKKVIEEYKESKDEGEEEVKVINSGLKRSVVDIEGLKDKRIREERKSKWIEIGVMRESLMKGDMEKVEIDDVM